MKTYTFKSSDGLGTYIGSFVNNAHAISHARWLVERWVDCMIVADGTVVAFVVKS